MKGGIGNLMKQAQKMQEDMQKAQEEMANIEVTGKSGGGMVTVVMTCRHDVKRISIDDSLYSDDKDMLEERVRYVLGYVHPDEQIVLGLN